MKSAQQVIGELQWLVGRSRPDLAYGVGALARLIHRRPGYVNRLASHMMRYLNDTKDLGLIYKKWNEDEVEVTAFGERQNPKRIDIFCDASFAPPHEKFRGVHGVIAEQLGNLLHWQSARQPFIARSTAESEVLGLCECHQTGQSVASLLEELHGEMECRIYNDSKSALTQCLNDTGPWRTKHLRLRASKIREVLREDHKWTAKHLDGKLLVADGLTKALGPQAFQAFRGRMRLGNPMKGAEQGGRVSLEPRDGMESTVARVARATLRDCGAVLIGGGTALLCGSKHKALGGLLLACGVTAACVDAQRNKQEPQGQQDPKGTNQEPLGQQDPKRTQQDPKGIIQEPMSRQDPKGTQQDPTGTNQEPIGQQDPERTPKDPERTQQDPKGTTNPHPYPSPQLAGRVGGLVPGIRAIRNPRKAEGRQHQNAAMDERPTGAQARGVAAMRQMDGYSGVSVRCGSSGDFETAPHATMEGRDPYHVNVKVDVTVELPQGEGSREGQRPVRPQPMGQGVREARSATGQRPRGSQGSSTGPEPSQEVEELKILRRFEKPGMRSTDTHRVGFTRSFSKMERFMRSVKGECLRISAFYPQIKKCTMKRMACQYSLSEGLCYLKKVCCCVAAKGFD